LFAAEANAKDAQGYSHNEEIATVVLGKSQSCKKIMFVPKPTTARRPNLGQRPRMTSDVEAGGP